MSLISVEDLLYGYSNGIFPMAESTSDEVYWYSPDPRAIIPIETYKPSKSLKPLINQKVFELRFNENFEKVIRHCAFPRFEGDETWISEEIIESYVNLHKIGFAHSVEVYQENALVGGLYGVSLGSVFFGESMFNTVPNASKVAFHYLMEHLKKKKFKLLDTQFINDNVKRFGAIEIPKKEFMNKLREALKSKNNFIND
ncbi:leucyl/phenylalanyl-tRNA--protein transferase [Lacihabitans sp. LS3-19]|uniref:leucyl/phenylalanyl-tRNA--protein transferase n=1 Tax=Lacihabitans sp. LS3-19 TaxID=2487335 RepID=UPI0020CD9C46|nr:leucyl/phenylalanyl-tRNA--protein transferase [Lacihabitans sp. LS3-19]MCP9770802.1 leucyl/phenylalanyl-tRNA--protein transferase [Lacihabitans sp. LS3-19]